MGLTDAPLAVWIIISALLGLVIGSFLNVVIYRWPIGESIVFPGSHCGSCNAKVLPYDNIPVVSYLVLGGKCRSCRAPFSIRYPAVELLTGALFAIAAAIDGPGWKLVFDCLFIAMVIPLVFIDAAVRLLPAVITVPGLGIALLSCFFFPKLVGMSQKMGGGGFVLGLGTSPDWYASLVNAAAGATLGGGLLFVLGIAYEIVRKREGMGLGDVSMMCFVGAYLGWELTLLTILIASVAGSVVGVVAARGRRIDEFQVPFGVFLGVGAVVSMLAGSRMIGWYLGLMQ
ncbi:MAG: prepilin peptidase [Acidobacteria bacterium]|nr:prepilin peptidase [Acidobacteriota bacterium]